MGEPFKYTSQKNGKTYVLNSRFFNGRTYYYFSGDFKNPEEQLPEGYVIIEAKNGVPMVARES